MKRYEILRNDSLGQNLKSFMIHFLMRPFLTNLRPFLGKKWPFWGLRCNFLKNCSVTFFLFSGNERPWCPLSTVLTPFWLNRSKLVKMTKNRSKMAHFCLWTAIHVTLERLDETLWNFEEWFLGPKCHIIYFQFFDSTNFDRFTTIFWSKMTILRT